METRMRPLSSPCEFGFVVFGRLTSGPFRICGAITMKMISNTSTTSTSGVMLMAACILAGSPSRMCHLRHDVVRLHLRRPDFRYLGLRYLEQVVHELGRSPVHLDMESLDLAREGVEGDDSRDRDEDTQSRRNEGLSDTARDHRHSARPRGRDAAESVDDSDNGSEE